MVGPHQWRLLILCSAYVVARGAENLISDDLHRLQQHRESKNLLPPFQPFSVVDNVRYIDNSHHQPRINDPHFGSFRFVATNEPLRRSDNLVLIQAPQQQQLLPPSPHSVNDATIVTYRDNSTTTTTTTTATSHAVEIVESIDLTDSARRSGFKYPETTFIPQGYSEDHSAAFELAGVRRPFFENHNEFVSEDGNDHIRLAELFGHGAGTGPQQTSRNQLEVVPAESTVQPVRIVAPDQAVAESQRLRGYAPTTIYYATNAGGTVTSSGDYRSRHYFPPKPDVYGEFQVIKKFPSTWKSRTPRVIFPIPDIPSAPGPPYSADSVVFK